MVLVVKSLPANSGDVKRHRFDSWEDPLEEEMATHSSFLAWTEEPGGLQSMWSQRVGHD